MDAALFAAGLATMYAAHQVADHVFSQTDSIAAKKVLPGRVGWSNILQHVFSYHVVMIIMLLTTLAALNLHVTLLGIILSMLFSATSHAFIDRRWPVRELLERTGSPGFAKMTTPLCGMYLADQSLHYLCLWISALLLCL